MQTEAIESVARQVAASANHTTSMNQSSNRSGEQLDAIVDQLSSKGGVNDPFRTATVHSQLAELVALGRKADWRAREEGASGELTATFVLIILAVISLILLWHGSGNGGDAAWLVAHRYALKMWGLGLSIVFLGVSLERSSFVSTLMRYSVTKVVATVALSALTIYCAGRASTMINAIFGADASAMPYARALLTGWFVFTHLEWPLFGVIGLFLLGHLLVLSSYLLERFGPSTSQHAPQDFPWQSLLIPSLAVIVLFNAWHLLFGALADVDLRKKVYELARVVDFNGRSSCINVPADSNLVFIGPAQDTVLIDTNSAATPDLEEFFERPSSGADPSSRSFPIVACERTAPQSKAASAPDWTLVTAPDRAPSDAPKR